MYRSLHVMRESWYIASSYAQPHHKRNLYHQIVPYVSYTASFLQLPYPSSSYCFSFCPYCLQPNKHFLSYLALLFSLLAHSEKWVHFKFTELYGKRYNTKCTSKCLDNTNLNAFSFKANWEISMMYSLIFPLPFYLIEMRFGKSVLV